MDSEDDIIFHNDDGVYDGNGIDDGDSIYGDNGVNGDDIDNNEEMDNTYNVGDTKEQNTDNDSVITISANDMNENQTIAIPEVTRIVQILTLYYNIFLGS